MGDSERLKKWAKEERRWMIHDTEEKNVFMHSVVIFESTTAV